jgi:hypothetical protein
MPASLPRPQAQVAGAGERRDAFERGRDDQVDRVGELGDPVAVKLARANRRIRLCFADLATFSP